VQHKVGQQIIARWERSRVERQLQRELRNPGVREDYLEALEALRRAA